MIEKLYAQRDAYELDVTGSFYIRHVSAMTSEGLHSKADIAAELGYRDSVISKLKADYDKLAAESAQMKSIIDAVTDLNAEPTYHEGGMGCGLEDRGIHDRYEAMRHGWDQAMERVYGEVIPCAEELDFKDTDAAIAELKSDARKEGIIFATNKILAAWESGFIDDTPAQAFDISGAVLSALEFLPNASDEEFKRDYADEVRAAIAAQLHAGVNS